MIETKRRIYKDRQRQNCYDVFVAQFRASGRPMIGSRLSTAFRDGFDGRRYKGDPGSTGWGAFMAGRDMARESRR